MARQGKKTPYDALLDGEANNESYNDMINKEGQTEKARATVSTITPRAQPKTESFTSAPTDHAYLFNKNTGLSQKMTKASAAKMATKYPKDFEIR